MRNIYAIFLASSISAGVFAQTENPMGTATELATQRTCSFVESWNDTRSGARLDGFFYIPVVDSSHFVIGGYGTRKRELTIEDCVLAVKASDRLVTPIAWELIWLDKGSGARLDGSMWRAIPPSDEYRCIGTVPQVDYERPRLSNYRCVPAEFTERVVTNALIWNDGGSGARKPVSMFKLPHSDTFIAVEGRPDQIEAYDLRLAPQRPSGSNGGQSQESPGSTPDLNASALGIEMVSIPGGIFIMGDQNGEGGNEESPVHLVNVPAFRLGKHEVTFVQWDVCVADGGCGGYPPEDEGWSRGRQPVINVSWEHAQDFIDWLNSRTGGNFRLPTEAEWEYAARAGAASIYHFGNDRTMLCDYANHADENTDYEGRNMDCSDGIAESTAAVGRYQPNSYGLHDMHGNVWEWVQDCWNDSYVGAPGNGSAWTSGDCGLRVLRGGAWPNSPKNLRSAYRIKASPDTHKNDVGFRLAQDM